MEFIRTMLIATTAMLWSAIIIAPVEFVRMFTIFSVWLSKSPLRMVTYILFGITLWAVWIVAFGWALTIAISVLGAILGAIRGTQVQEEIYNMYVDLGMFKEYNETL